MNGTVRTFSHGDFAPESLFAAKRGRRVSVCLPARDEARTIGAIVSTVHGELTSRGGGLALVDQIVVIDDGSDDGTVSAARRGGAEVVSNGSPCGKGEAMRLGLDETDGEVVVFLDADVENFSSHFVIGLLGPILSEEEGSVALVKGFYERPLEGKPSGGGRVTELTARPAIELLFPHLAGIRQPLAGESAAPREVLEKTGIAPGYGAELGLLVDVAARYGTGSIAQVDLGVRVHRNRPLSELRHQATDVLRAALERSDLRE